MDHRYTLFHWPDPYDVSGTEELFLAAVRENCLYESAHCPAYRRPGIRAASKRKFLYSFEGQK